MTSSGPNSPANKDAIHCAVHLPDDRTPLDVYVKKTETGLDLLEKVFEIAGVVEKDYFGVTFKDHSGVRRWLEPQKTTAHQFAKLRNPVQLNLVVKFYPNDPMHLRNEFSRYLLFRQVRNDIHDGRIFIPETAIPRLLGMLLQAEFSDWSPQLSQNYVDQVKFRADPIAAVLKEQAIGQHKNLAGLTDKEMEIQFVQEISDFASYGLDMYACKDQEDASLLVGLGCNGITTFAFGKVTHSFKWREILKMYHEGKQFFATVRLREHKHLCAFRCPTTTQAKVMWKSAMERKTFFTAVSSTENNHADKRSALSLVLKRSTTFNFHGRVQREVIKDDIERESPFQRFSYASNTLPRMGKAGRSGSENTPAQMNMLTPSPSPSAKNSMSTLGQSPGSEKTMIETPLPQKLQQETPPSSPEVVLILENSMVQSSRLASLPEESHASEQMHDVSATSLNSNFTPSVLPENDFETVVGSTASDGSQAGLSATPEPNIQRTYSIKDDEESEPEKELEKVASKVTTEVFHSVEQDIVSGKENLICSNGQPASNAPCYHKSANAKKPTSRSTQNLSAANANSNPFAILVSLLASLAVMLLLVIAAFESTSAAQLPPFIRQFRQTIYEPLRQAFVSRVQQQQSGRGASAEEELQY